MAWVKKSATDPNNPFSDVTFDTPAKNMVNKIKGLGTIGNLVGNTALINNLSSQGIKVYDSFNRPDSAALGSTDTGQAWEYINGTGGISNNQVGAVSSMIAVVQTNLADVQTTLTNSTTAVSNAIYLRVSDLNNLMKVSHEANGYYRFLKKAAGSYSIVGDTTITPVNGDVLKVVCSGNTLSFYLNGTLTLTATDSFNATATKHGMGSTSGKVDNFQVEG